MDSKLKNTQEKIIEAALHLAKNEGWKDTTIRRICQEAGVSIGSFYHHFKSKQEVVNKSFMVFDNTLVTECADCQSPVDEVKDLLLKQAKFIVEEAGMVTAEYYATLLQGEEFLAANPNRVYYKKILDFIKEADELGLVKDEYSPKYIANFLIKFNRGCIIDWCLNDYSYNVLDVVDKELDLIIDLFLVNECKVK